MYLCTTLREHTLLQAIARVNRLHEDETSHAAKEFGYIVDYASVLGELDKALTMYAEAGLAGFDEEDLAGTLRSVREEVAKLPQRHSDLWDIFKSVKNRRDEESYETLLADDALREDFYDRLTEYGKTLALALSTEGFIMGTPEAKIEQYKDDLKRFQKLKASVKLRYAESIDYRDYEPKIQKLLDTHITASEVTRLNEPVNIFDDKSFLEVKEERGVYESKTTAARADAIAHATKRTITEHMEEDPAFYEKFSKLIQQAIDDFRAKRISDQEYLKRSAEIRDSVVNRKHDDIPEILQGNEHAIAFYGILKPYVTDKEVEGADVDKALIEAALAISGIFEQNLKVNFWDDNDAQKRTMNDIDDYLYDVLKREHGVTLATEQMDEIIERSMQLARHRMPA
jgi:type I restriction enzyme R subunit